MSSAIDTIFLILGEVGPRYDETITIPVIIIAILGAFSETINTVASSGSENVVPLLSITNIHNDVTQIINFVTRYSEIVMAASSDANSALAVSELLSRHSSLLQLHDKTEALFDSVSVLFNSLQAGHFEHLEMDACLRLMDIVENDHEKLRLGGNLLVRSIRFTETLLTRNQVDFTPLTTQWFED